MPSGNRLFNAALRGCLIGGILCSGVALGHAGKPESKPPENKPAAEQAAPIKPAAAPVALKKSDTPEQAKSLCDKPQTPEERDLCQQWRMAEAAEKQAKWTERQFWATVAEVAGLMAIIIFTGWAGRAAMRSAKAAEDVVSVTSNTAKHQLRAYVAQEVIIWTTLEQPETKAITGYNLTLRWKNCGSTPAGRCRTWFSIGFFKNGLPKDFDYPDALTGKVTVSEKAQMGPNGTIASTVGCTIAKTQAAQRGETKIFAWGWIEYDDIFEGTPRRRTEVCFEAVIGPDTRSFTPTITGPFNGTDDDCHHQPKT